MKANITIKDVAENAGCSLGTVSRVINGKSVGVKTREKVERSMKVLGYTPNAIAQSMRTNATQSVALVVNDISNPLFSGIAKAAEDVLRQHGFSLLISNSNNNPQVEVEILETLKKRRIDGLFIAIADESYKPTQEILSQLSFPVVLLDRSLPQSFDSVCDDHSMGMKQAVKYLMDLGHTRIHLINVSDKIRPGKERLSAFQHAFQNGKIKLDSEQISYGRMDAEYGYEEAFRILNSPNRPTAIIAGGNQIFTGVLRAVKRCNLEIPKDISIIACDDIDLTVLMRPSVTVISRNIKEIGNLAGELLIRRIQEPNSGEERQILIPTELLVRESCAKPFK